MKKLIKLSLLCLFASCSTHPKLKTVEHVDIPRFMGKWYVISNIPTFIEKGAHNAVEIYTWNAKENRIDVDFSFNKSSFDGEKKKYPQKGFIYNKESNAEWRIQPFWPLKFAYLVVELADDYSWTVIGVPDRSYIWIMARTPTLPKQTYDMIIDKIKRHDFDVSKIKKVPQKH